MDGACGDDDSSRTFQIMHRTIHRHRGMSFLYQKDLYEMVMAMDPDLPVMQRTALCDSFDMRETASAW